MVTRKCSQILFFVLLMGLVSSCELFTPITAESTVRYRSDRKVSASATLSTRTRTRPSSRNLPPPPPPPKSNRSRNSPAENFEWDTEAEPARRRAEASTSRTRTEARPALTREEMLREDVVQYAKQFVGTKYVYAGKDPRGFDCSGFTRYVWKEFDVSLSGSSRMQEDQGTPISVSKAKAGDLIFFRREKHGRVFHVALVVSNSREGLRVIHSTNRGVVIDNISNNSYWKPKISTARDVF
ncbi:MAG: C40 family peptidase [Saprospiraceae bacterium]|nr:C40 family peptidase [Saprospiraceae bacterium]